MYKKRFTAWGLFKNKTQRRAGRTGHPPLVKATHTAGADAVTLWYGRDAKAPVAALGRPLSSGLTDEVAIHSISTWTNGSFDSTRWLWINQRSKGSGANAPVTYPSTRLYQDFALARALLDRGEGALAGMAIRKGFWFLEDVVKGGDPAVLRNLVDIFYQGFQVTKLPLINMLLHQLAGLATRELPARHPLVQYFQFMSRSAKEEGTSLAELFSRSWRCYVEAFHRRMDHSFYWMYENWAWDTSVRSIDSDPEQDYKHITEALQALALRTEAVESTAVSRSHLELLKYTNLMRSDGFYKTSAANVLKTIENGVSRTSLGAGQMGGYAETYVKTAMVKQAMDDGDWNAAEGIMRADIEKLEAIHGVTSREVIRQLWSLEKVMRKAGDYEGANAVSAEAIERVRGHLADVPSYLG